MPVRELPSLTAHILSAWLSDQGLPISAGTLGDSAHRFVPLFEPVAEAILAHQNEAAVRHGDETPWRIQSLRETSRSSRAWLWTSVSEDAVYFHLVMEDAALAFTADLGDQVGDEHRLPHPRVPETMVCWVSVLSGYRERQFGLWVQRANLSRRAVGSACPFRLISGLEKTLTRSMAPAPAVRRDTAPPRPIRPGEELLLVAQTDGFNASGKALGGIVPGCRIRTLDECPADHWGWSLLEAAEAMAGVLDVMERGASRPEPAGDSPASRYLREFLREAQTSTGQALAATVQTGAGPRSAVNSA